MNNKTEIIIGGIGGQGIVLSSIVLAEAAVLSGYESVQTQSYGVESRGGYSSASVIISRAPINYPEVESADFCLLLNQKAVSRIVNYCSSKSLVIVDSDNVQNIEILEKEGVIIKKYSIFNTASNLGNIKAMNFVAIGVINQYLDIPLKYFSKAMSKKMVLDTVKSNEEALQKGYEL